MSAVETAVECWQWVLTARTDLELCFIQEMVNAWQTTISFHNLVVAPHTIWLQLIAEMVDTVKYCNRDKVEMFCLLLHRCLPIVKDSKQNGSVSTVGCRFKLLQSGFVVAAQFICNICDTIYRLLIFLTMTGTLIVREYVQFTGLKRFDSSKSI